jgi:4-amino-4-deoxy-L-arabinose transferase-like glycosyltransferase
MKACDSSPTESFPATAWSRRDWFNLGLLFVLSAILLWANLSVRSLWGPEGRWALIVREMMRSGDYFTPTCNGILDFDKPLLSYWAIIPFASLWGTTEAMLRVPSTLAGIGVTLTLYALGRRLFGTRDGLIASLLWITTMMFLLWARTASAEILNLFAIWFMFWAFVSGAQDGRWKYVLFFYSVGALSSFLKGPVAPAVAGTAAVAYSLFEAVSRLVKARRDGEDLTWTTMRGTICQEFRWIFSKSGVLGLLFGLIVFAFLLFLPVLVTGSFTSVELMWKENIIRFFSPFDHADPIYSYPQHILRYAAPWTFFMLASLWEARKWTSSRAARYVLLISIAIFLFFTASGSRRSYYILPLMPALALITGHALSQWLDDEASHSPPLMHTAAILTPVLVIAAGLSLLYIYFFMPLYRHGSLIPMALWISAAGCLSLFCFIKRKTKPGFVVILVAVMTLEFWFFGQGMRLSERKRTLIEFVRYATTELKGVSNDKIALYQYGTASLIFYLNRSSNTANVNTVTEIEEFRKQHPDGYLIVDLNEVYGAENVAYMKSLEPIAIQNTEINEKAERFVLFKFPHETPAPPKGTHP